MHHQVQPFVSTAVVDQTGMLMCEKSVAASEGRLQEECTVLLYAWQDRAYALSSPLPQPVATTPSSTSENCSVNLEMASQVL